MKVNSCKRLKNYISNIRASSTLTEDDICVEHRANNAKRDFLFVNKKQAKHIPCKPSDTVAVCRALADVILADLQAEDKVLIIAMAETATCIGHLIADQIQQCVLFLQTTRRQCASSGCVLSFSEEHSHAPQHFLYLPNKDTMPYFNRILFIDDEITTGKTIINLINTLLAWVTDRNIQYGVASFCNWQDKESLNLFYSKNIKRYFLMSGEIINTNTKMQGEFVSPKTVSESYEYNSVGVIRSSLQDVYSTVKSLKLPKSKPIRVIGSEEFMYIPFCIARYLEGQGYSVKCHSTTRSPIDSFSSNTDGIYNGATFPSMYGNYEAHLYCGPAIDELVLFVTDKSVSCEVLNLYKNYLKTDIVVLEVEGTNEFS